MRSLPTLFKRASNNETPKGSENTTANKNAAPKGRGIAAIASGNNISQKSKTTVCIKNIPKLTRETLCTIRKKNPPVFCG